MSVMKTKQLIDISSLTTSVVRSSFILDLELVDEVFHNYAKQFIKYFGPDGLPAIFFKMWKSSLTKPLKIMWQSNLN